MSENQNKEIERKFLLKNNMSKSLLIMLEKDFKKKMEIEQFYLSGKPVVHRYRLTDGKEVIRCYKSGKSESGLSCIEKEYPSNLSEYNDLKHLSIGIVYKTRYILDDVENDKKLEFDVYKDRLKGLFVLEVEFKTEESALNYKIPEFLKLFIEKEVTKDYNYSNFNLSKPENIITKDNSLKKTKNLKIK